MVEIVPKGLSIMLLTVKHRSGNPCRDMIRDVVPQHKGNGLSFMYLNPANETFANHSLLLYPFECDMGTSVAVVSLLKDHIQLKSHIFAMEGGNFALRVDAGE